MVVYEGKQDAKSEAQMIRSIRAKIKYLAETFLNFIKGSHCQAFVINFFLDIGIHTILSKKVVISKP
jgi:hypothetical protein